MDINEMNDTDLSDYSCYMPEAWSLEYIRSNWKKLEGEADISFFQSWFWIDPWLAVAKKLVKPIIFKHKKQIVGISFVGLGKTKDHKILNFKSTIPWGTGIDAIDVCSPEYNTPIIKKGHEKQVRQSLVHFLMTDKRFQHYPRIHMRRILEDDFEDYVLPHYAYEIYKKEDSAEVDLNYVKKNNSLEDIISKGAMSQIKKSIDLYEEKFGKITYEVSDNTTKAHNWFVELGKLNQARFNKKSQKSQKSAWDYPKLLQMHRALLDRYFSKGCAEIVRVRAGEKIIGYLYNFIFRGRIYFYMGGFVYEVDNKYKPGLVTHYYAILHHLEKGNHCYDFMAGDESYKKRLGSVSPKMIHFTITKPHFKYFLSQKIEYLKNIISGIKLLR